jgi:hypothetical protein
LIDARCRIAAGVHRCKEDDMKVVFKKKRIDFATLEADADFKRLSEPVVAVGSGLPESGVAFAFRNWKEFAAFAKRTKAADQIAALDEQRRKLRRRSYEDTSAVAARQKLKAERIEADLRELAARTGLAWGSKELFLRATAKADPLEGQIFDPAMLYTGIGFTGNALGVAYPGVPNLGWFTGMNNAVSSVQVLGFAVLFAGANFGGASRVLFGAPYFQIANLGTIGFNNVTSSVLLY